MLHSYNDVSATELFHDRINYCELLSLYRLMSSITLLTPLK